MSCLGYKTSLLNCFDKAFNGKFTLIKSNKILISDEKYKSSEHFIQYKNNQL